MTPTDRPQDPSATRILECLQPPDVRSQSSDIDAIQRALVARYPGGRVEFGEADPDGKLVYATFYTAVE